MPVRPVLISHASLPGEPAYHLSESLHGQALLSGEHHVESPPSTITDRTKDGYLTPSVSGIFEAAHFQKRKTFG